MPKSIPTIGDSNWGTPLNNHLAQLQNPTNGGINSFEQFSGRPTTLTADDVGKTYIYTQTGNLHQWTGTSWKVLNESVINVKDYGAVGDGVTDDTVVIQRCFDGYNAIFIPKGFFVTTLKLIINKPNFNLQLEGELILGDTLVFVNGDNAVLEGNKISVSNSFVNGGNAIELGTSTSVNRVYN